MTPEQYLEEKNIFGAIVHLGRAERLKQLDIRCAGDKELRAGVLSLLEVFDNAPTEDFAPDDSVPALDGVPIHLPDFGVYKNITYAGHGGMGVVYRAYHSELCTEVALKMVLPGLCGRADVVRLFRTEPQHMIRLNHANVVRVLECNERAGQPFFTMKFIEGTSLHQHLDRYRQDPRAAAALLVKVARALGHAHQCGLVHRDLKPGNVLMTVAGEPIVTDFGLAKCLDLETPTNGAVESPSSASQMLGGIVGTYPYMSPEQATPGATVKVVSDVYGLGAILYALLTGCAPFPGHNREEILARVRSAAMPVNPRAKNAHVDLDLEAICLKCLNKNPADRYQTAESLAQDLERYLADQEPVVARWPVPYRLWRWVRRNPVWAAAVVAGLLVAGLLDGGNAYARLQERERKVLESNAYTAQSVANTFDTRLQSWSWAVRDEARDERLRAALRTNDRAELERLVGVLHTSYADPANGYPRGANGRPPFASWFVMDNNGTVVAHSDQNRDAKVVPAVPWRNHFIGAKAKNPGEVHVSRVYQSFMGEAKYKFALSTPLYDGDRWCGVLATTVMTDSAEATLLPKEAPQKAVLVGRWDGNRPPPGFPHDARTDLHIPGQSLILLHPGYAYGDKAVEINNERLLADREADDPRHRTDDHYLDPVAARDPRFAGRWLAASAPVPHTEFVVIVQQEYNDAVQPFAIVGRPLIVWSLVLVALVVTGLAMGVSVVRRRQQEKAPGSTQAIFGAAASLQAAATVKDRATS